MSLLRSMSLSRRSRAFRQVVEPDRSRNGTERDEPNTSDRIIPRRLREVVAAHKRDDVADVVLPAVGRVVGEHGAERQLQVVLDQLEADLRAQGDGCGEPGELKDGAGRRVREAEAIEEALVGAQRRRHSIRLAEDG